MFEGEKIKNNNESNFKKETITFIIDLIIIILLVVLIRSFLILPFQISGHSMNDSYYDKEFIIVDRFSYLTYKEPKRGDVVVFNTHIKKKEYFIKRVIGLPGETIKIHNGKVYVKKKNEPDTSYKLLDEKYLSQENYNGTYVISESVIPYVYNIPEGHYFVMGDNRKHSTDSRECFSRCIKGENSNFIKRKDVIGQVLLDLGYFSFRHFKFIQNDLGINSFPRFFDSPSSYEYK